jgi:predicted aldo/keto reductase-like oxidoreductase
MLYRTLGRTGLKVSQLGFGAMRLPMTGQGRDAKVDRELALPMFHRAFEAGVNYVDTAVGYCNHDSQCVLGEALKGWRERIVVSTKNPYYGPDEKEWWGNLQDSLTRLNLSAIDIYSHHGINWKAYCQEVEPRVGKWMRKAKSQGLIRHICTSFHDRNDALIKIVDTGYVDVVTLQYNMLDRGLEGGIAHAVAKGVGVVVMGPVGGGRLGADSEVLSKLLPSVGRVPELAMRFVLSNPHVSVALSGMSTMQQVRQNIAVCSDPRSLDAQERQLIDEQLGRLKGMADLYCTACGYCKPCPNKVDIPAVFGLYNQARVYGLWELAKKRYGDLAKKGVSASACVQCGECEPKCPQKIRIQEQLQESHGTLNSQA